MIYGEKNARMKQCFSKRCLLQTLSWKETLIKFIGLPQTRHLSSLWSLLKISSVLLTELTLRCNRIQFYSQMFRGNSAFSLFFEKSQNNCWIAHAACQKIQWCLCVIYWRCRSFSSKNELRSYNVLRGEKKTEKYQFFLRTVLFNFHGTFI